MGTIKDRVAIPEAAADMIPTRQSLLSRLRDWNDQESWKTFFDTYWKLIYRTALKAGLSEVEAEDVVQETLICVSKSMPGFKYRETNRSFKSWLLQLTAWRINDRLRQRQLEVEIVHTRESSPTKTATIERMADPAGPELETFWEAEWKSNLMELAVSRVKERVNPKQYQIFDFYVLKKWPLGRVTKALNVSPTAVYLAKHRLTGLIKKEIAKLQSKSE